MKRWHGIGYKFGYEERTEKDGSWRIDTAVHGRGEAIDIALYRAAERARDEGYRYVFFLGGSGSKSPGIDAATVYARPSHEPTPPKGCRSKKATTCYTADVAEVLRILGGPDGTQPGVAVLDHRDEFGREVFRSGYGTGGIASLIPGGEVRSHVATIVETRPKGPRTIAPHVVPQPIPVAIASVRPGMAAVESTTIGLAVTHRGVAPVAAIDRFDHALEASQPARGRDPQQGWTISD